MKANIIKSLNAKVNRISVILAVWCVILAYCAFISTNVYLNAFLICTGFILAILAAAYLFDAGLNKKEEKFLNKGLKLFGME